MSFLLCFKDEDVSTEKSSEDSAHVVNDLLDDGQVSRILELLIRSHEISKEQCSIATLQVIFHILALVFVQTIYPEKYCYGRLPTALEKQVHTREQTLSLMKRLVCKFTGESCLE